MTDDKDLPTFTATIEVTMKKRDGTAVPTISRAAKVAEHRAKKTTEDFGEMPTIIEDATVVGVKRDQ